MSAKPGTCGWLDLTVEDAPRVRDFYAAVIGWTVQDVPMQGYADFAMTNPGQPMPAAGVCHARGVNASLPAVWIPYFIVADLHASVAEVTSRGGTVLRGPEDMGPWGRAAWIRDPAGAACCIVQPPG